MQSQAAELKQQGAIEAARDSESNVTAEDAERKLIEETKRAGLQAYQFDPNASPEEKAAQTRAHLPPDFHHERKHKAVGLVSDIDDGTPDQYDLPSPSKAGALAASAAGAANGHAQGPHGHAPTEDDAWWTERAGWAPRFGTGAEHDEGPDGRDQSTFLETRLEEKFFGDWYHNTAVIIFACLSSWLVAVLGGGLAWVFLIMATCGTYYRTSIRRVRRNFRDDVNRQMAKAKIEKDVESLEWINSFMVKFWPIYEPVLCDTIISSVDQVLSTSTPAFLDSLRLKSFILGSKPPRLEHVKTYPKTEDDIVLMDWKFSFTPTDTADLTARQIKNKINPKVVLEVRIGKAMVSKGLDVIVEDMAFSGLMRVKFKLQIPFPHVERVEICFLERPTIDYVCKPLGGDTFGFDIGFLPGLQSFIMEQIHGNIGPIMYDPNVFPIEVAKMIAGNAVDQAIGVLAITLHGAQGLKNTDSFSGSPDPYVVVSLNGRVALGKTKIIKENANPRWNETKYVIITSFKDNLTLQVFDFNDYRKDKELGTATFALDQLERETEYDNLQLEVMGNGKARGIVQADVHFFPVLEGTKLPDGKMTPPPESNTGIARFTVEQAKDLDGTKSLVGQSNPYAVLLLNGKEVHVSKKIKRTNNPIWDDGSKEVLITDRRNARLGLVIKDERELSADVILGTYQIKVDDVLQMMEKGQEWYNLAGAKSGRAKLTCQWKPVGLTGAVTGSGGYVTPIGVMRFHFQSAKDLRNLETMGKSDPYVRILLSSVERGRTVTFKNNLNPDWDEVLYVPMHSTREKLTVEVMDEETLNKDRSLGLVEVAASDYVKQADDGEYLVHEERKLLSDPLRMAGRGMPKGTLNFTVSFYPTLSVVDPEKEEQEKKAKEEADKIANKTPESGAKKDSIDLENERKAVAGKVDDKLAKQLTDAEEEQAEEKKEEGTPKIRLSADDLAHYESGLIIFKLIEGDLTQANCHLEVLIDDMRFPSYTSSRAKTRHVKFDEMGDTFVRELDVSQITLRLRERADRKGDEKEDRTLAKLTGDTLSILKQALYKPTVLTLKDSEGGFSKVTVSLRYLPVKMQLDPSESINNSGELRVDVLDAVDLPSADRNGFSDPFCRFQLNGKEVFKTKIIKKTLNPSWNEFFVVPITSRIAAKFNVHVMDWDLAGEDDFLGETDINLELLDPLVAKEYKLTLDGKSGVLRLRLHFKPNYVTRTRHGTSTFSGTFAAPTKIVTGVAGAPIKGAGMVGGGVVKGASFIRHGFRGKKKNGEGSISTVDQEEIPDGEVFSSDSPKQINVPGVIPPVNGDSTESPVDPTVHNRSRSFGTPSIKSAAGVKAAGPDTGTAHLTLFSASGYPASAHVRVHIKQITTKGAKDVFKSKAVKSSTGEVTWEPETVKLSCAADTQFQVQVKDHSTFGTSDDLGEALFFVDDSTAGSEKTLKAGNGSVILRTSFNSEDTDGSFRDSPKSTAGSRRSFLGRK